MYLHYFYFQSITINTEHSTYNKKEWLCVERITIIKIQNMMINRTVSYYNNADDSKSKIRYNLDYVLGMIKDNQELFQQTVRLRSMPTEKEYKQAKKLLPMLAPSCLKTIILDYFCRGMCETIAYVTLIIAFHRSCSDRRGMLKMIRGKIIPLRIDINLRI